MSTEIKTPETHPDHEIVGWNFAGHDGHFYFCDSYNPRIGFWMTRLDCPAEHRTDLHSEWRRNVSERAIGRTFHRIDEYGFSRFGRFKQHASKKGS